MRKLVLTCFLAACMAASARAAVIGVAPTATTAGSIQITAPITFTINVNDTARLIALSGWVNSDGSQNTSVLTPNMALTLDGTAMPTASRLVDNLNGTSGSLGSNDGYFLFNATFAVAAGNTLTLSAGTYALSAASSFNQQATQTFTGNLFVGNVTGVQISNLVPAGNVPEPGTWALLAVGAAGLGVVTLRHRQRTV